jgi:outer membrane protein assembly factor BamE (lipoprotein component of BamABCDE complex)
MSVRLRALATRLGLGLTALLAVCSTPADTRAEESFAIALVGPGMNRTELTSVLGPPSYIQVKGLREAWQYCPRRSLTRFLQDVLRQERPPDLYVTVWFNEGRVEHMRAYPSRVMGRCEDFLAAFSWEDAIGGAGFEGGYRIK